MIRNERAHHVVDQYVLLERFAGCLFRCAFDYLKVDLLVLRVLNRRLHIGPTLSADLEVIELIGKQLVPLVNNPFDGGELPIWKCVFPEHINQRS